MMFGSKLFLIVIPHKIHCVALGSLSTGSPIVVDMSESMKNTKDGKPGSASDMSVETLKNTKDGKPGSATDMQGVKQALSQGDLMPKLERVRTYTTLLE
jgi:hypothetical protein